MTHHEQRTPWGDALEALSENGFDGMAEAMRVLVNEAMKVERSAFLGAEPHERTDQRRGYANGFKRKRVRTRLGEIDVQVPQVRDVEGGDTFYPSSLERGQRSERALTLALAEMYVQGVSTRRVEAITKVLCNGLEISSTSVSRAAALLDEELERWRTRPLGAFKYLVLDARYEKVRHGGSVRDCAVLIAIGVDSHGKRSVLGTAAISDEITLEFDVDITEKFGGFVGGPDTATLSITFDTSIGISIESDPVGTLAQYKEAVAGDSIDWLITYDGTDYSRNATELAAIQVENDNPLDEIKLISGEGLHISVKNFDADAISGIGLPTTLDTDDWATTFFEFELFNESGVVTDRIRGTLTTVIPEPTSLALLGLGVAGLAWRRGRARD